MSCGGGTVNPPGFTGGGGRIDILIPKVISVDSDGDPIPVTPVVISVDSGGDPITPVEVYVHVRNFPFV